MRLPRARFTVRALMIVIAVAGVTIGLCVMHWKRADCIRKARWYRDVAEHARMLASGKYANKTNGDETAYKEKAAFYDNLSEKYANAGRHPWLPVEPDPPEPE